MVITDGLSTEQALLRKVTSPLTGLATAYAELARLKGPHRLREERIRLEQDAAECMAALQEVRAEEKARALDPFAKPVVTPTPERQKLYDDCDAAAARLIEFPVQERPWLICDGLAPAQIRKLISHSFDRCLFNYSPAGDAWHSLLRLGAAARTEVLSLMRAGFYGDAVVIGTEAIPQVTVTNLWSVRGLARTTQNWRGLREDPLWETFFFVQSKTVKRDLNSQALLNTKLDEWWCEFVRRVFKLRGSDSPGQHQLTTAATEYFVTYYNNHRREVEEMPTSVGRFACRRPEQVLKIALLLHLTGETANALDIEVEELQVAAALAQRLGGEKLDSDPAVFAEDPEIEVHRMIDKLHMHGKQRKRDLFRKYNTQDYASLEPTLARAIATGQVKVDGEFLSSVD